MRRFLRTTIGVVFSASPITAFVSFSCHMLWDCHHHEWFLFLFWVGGKHLERPKNWGLWLPPKMIAFIQAYGKVHVKSPSQWCGEVPNLPNHLVGADMFELCLSVLAILLHVSCVCHVEVSSLGPVSLSYIYSTLFWEGQVHDVFFTINSTRVIEYILCIGPHHFR